MKFWEWPKSERTTEPMAEPPNGRVKVVDKSALRGYRIIPASALKPSDIVIERYPEDGRR